MATSVDVGKRADTQRCCVRGHVQTVGEQCHRTIVQPGDNLQHHHSTRQNDNEERATFALLFFVLSKHVFVLPAL